MTTRFAGLFVMGTLLFGCADGGASGETSPVPEPVAAEPSDARPAPVEEAPVAEPPAQGNTTTPPPATNDCAGKSAQPRDATWKLRSGGLERVFDVHVPAGYAPTRRAPVVFDFHGFTSDEKQQALLSGMNKKSDEAGFIAVHPRGTGAPLSWNAGACCGQASLEKVDDVRFVRDMLERLESELCVDGKRVFATGMSNGGFLSHRLACEMSDRIAAVAPVAGVLGIESCAAARPVPVMHFHGTLDTLVPYRGEPVKGFPSVATTIKGWASRNQCTGDAVESYRSFDTHCETHSGCRNDATVTLCTVEGGGHTWPGGTPVPPLGHTTYYLSATDAMWDFFASHPMR